MDQRLFAPPHDFSQLITSFIACKSLGIHRTPFLTCLHAPHLCGRCLLKVVRFSKFNEFMSLKSLISFSLMLFVLLNFLEDYLYCLKFARFFVTLFNCLIWDSEESCVVQYVKDRLQRFLYSVATIEWRISGSNRWPLACHASALANWANPPYLKGKWYSK